MGPVIFVDRSFRVIDASESARVFFDLGYNEETILTEISDIIALDGKGNTYSVPDRNSELTLRYNGEAYKTKIFILPESTLRIKAVVYIDVEPTRAEVEIGERPENIERLVELGTIAGSIAHDLNNLLMAVLGHISYLRLTSDGPIDDSLRSAEDGARKASQLSKQILDFAKLEDPLSDKILSRVDLCELTRSSIPLLSPNLPSGISISLKCPDNCLFIDAKESQITQILLNLIVNARDAMLSGGVISIDIGTVALADSTVIHGFNLSAGNYIRLIVTDTGNGISEEVQSRMFEPFFTTKKGTGTGLGLATVFFIVKDLKGAIDVKSRKNSGSAFSLILPLSESQSNMEGDPSSKVAEHKKFDVADSEKLGKILVVDDEDSIRLVLERSLDFIGYTAFSAENGERAIEIFKKHHSEINLVIMDMIMPGIPGFELYYLLKEINPSVKVLISSGYSSDQKTRQLIKDGALGLIQKPFAVEELLDKVKNILFRA